MKQVQLKTLKQGDLFKRKESSENVFIREHYNPQDPFGPASYCCTNWFDIGNSIQLKGSTLVIVVPVNSIELTNLHWTEYVNQGKLISAIKALRSITQNYEGENISLSQAKSIVVDYRHTL